jgi:hypothetical protein
MLLDDLMLPFQGVKQLTLEPMTGTNLHISFTYEYVGNQNLKSQFENAIFQPTWVEKEGILTLEKSTNFTKEVPFIFFQRTAKISVPEGYSLEFVGEYSPWIK